jgi:SSS family solute:Na+ symporter
MLGWTQGAVFGSPLWLVIYTTIVYGVGIGVLAQPQLAVRFMTVSSDQQLNRAVLIGGIFMLAMTGVAFVSGALSNVIFFEKSGQVAIDVANGNVDAIIPVFVSRIMPGWFGTLFLLAMFAAAMSTLSSQYHVGGTSLGRDFYEKGLRFGGANVVTVNRIGVFVTVLVTMIWGLVLPISVIARATAFFFGLCAAAFLPSYFLGLYWKGMTRAGAIASMVGGFGISFFYLLFVHTKESKAIGLCNSMFGVDSLALWAEPGSTAWLLQFTDPNIIALPISFILALLVRWFCTGFDSRHINICFRDIDR